MRDGGVEAENLQDKQMDRLDRAQLPFAPAMSSVAAGRHNRGLGEIAFKVLLDRANACETLAIRGLLCVMLS